MMFVTTHRILSIICIFGALSIYVTPVCVKYGSLADPCNEDPSRGAVHKCRSPLICDQFWRQCFVPLGGPCNITHDCDAYNECVGGKCVRPTLGSGIQQKCRLYPGGPQMINCATGTTCDDFFGRCLFTPCREDPDCVYPSDFPCKNGVCVTPPVFDGMVGESCNLDASKGPIEKCLSPLSCDPHWNKCYVTLGGDCSITHDCDGFNECVGGKCVPPTLGSGVQQKCRSYPGGPQMINCTAGTTCDEYFGRCLVDPCKVDSDCVYPSDFPCKSGLCVTPPMQQGVLGDPCNLDASKGPIKTCYSPLVCDSHWLQCFVPLGGACMVTHDCDGFNECVGGKCVPPTLGSGVQQKCRSVPGGPQLVNCTAGTTCNQYFGRCLLNPCKVDSDCVYPDDYSCVKGACDTPPMSNGTVGKNCNLNANRGPIQTCLSSLVCDQHWFQCYVPLGGLCSTTHDCDGFNECIGGICTRPTLGSGVLQKCRYEPGGPQLIMCTAGTTCSSFFGRCLVTPCKVDADCVYPSDYPCRNGVCVVPSF